MILIADKQIRCGGCGARIGLQHNGFRGLTYQGKPLPGRESIMVNDSCVVTNDDESEFYCNVKCRDKAKV